MLVQLFLSQEVLSILRQPSCPTTEASQVRIAVLRVHMFTLLMRLCKAQEKKGLPVVKEAKHWHAVDSSPK